MGRGSSSRPIIKCRQPDVGPNCFLASNGSRTPTPFSGNRFATSRPIALVAPVTNLNDFISTYLVTQGITFRQLKKSCCFPGSVSLPARIQIYRIGFSFGTTESLLAEKIVCGYFLFGSKTDEAQSRTSQRQHQIADPSLIAQANDVRVRTHTRGTAT